MSLCGGRAVNFLCCYYKLFASVSKVKKWAEGFVDAVDVVDAVDAVDFVDCGLKASFLSCSLWAVGFFSSAFFL